MWWWEWTGTSFDLDYGSLPEHLELRDPSNTLIDGVDYDGGWPFADGHAMYLCTNHRNAGDNDNSSNWQQDNVNDYDPGDNYGTPASGNPGTCN